MNTEFFIAKRLSLDKVTRSRLSQLMSYISIVSIALSIMVMIIAIAVLTGFKTQLQEKITGFNAPLRVTNYDSNQSFETVVPILNDYPFYDTLRVLPEVRHVQQYALKGGIISTGSDIQGVVLKGIGSDFDWSFFRQYLVDGEVFMPNDSVSSNMVLISEQLSALLKLKIGDKFKMFFVQEPVRMREFTISGLYNTHFDELDRTFVVCDIRHIRRLNGWASNDVSGMEILLHDVRKLDRAYRKVDDLVSYRTLSDGSRLNLSSIHDSFPQIFNWLAILDMNVLIILVLMLVVSGFNMISGLLILLLEKVPMIGLLKALGMTNKSVRLIFIYRSAVIVFRGLLWGNFIGIGLCLLQQQFGLITLDPKNYYFSVAPIELNVGSILLLNVAAFLFVLTVQLLPSIMVARISPEKTIRME